MNYKEEALKEEYIMLAEQMEERAKEMRVALTMGDISAAYGKLAAIAMESVKGLHKADKAF
ncbi:hypothetical protein [Bacillus mycoides]|uniref:hypothetical protein n=1 Tax=Bacillus mycoides TaxID=1405 RepID=UPI003A801C12